MTYQQHQAIKHDETEELSLLNVTSSSKMTEDQEDAKKKRVTLAAKVVVAMTIAVAGGTVAAGRSNASNLKNDVASSALSLRTQELENVQMIGCMKSQGTWIDEDNKCIFYCNNDLTNFVIPNFIDGGSWEVDTNASICGQRCLNYEDFLTSDESGSWCPTYLNSYCGVNLVPAFDPSDHINQEQVDNLDGFYEYYCLSF